MKKRTVFLDTLPVMTGYLFLGIGFGILLNEAGYGIGWAFSMSLMIYLYIQNSLFNLFTVLSDTSVSFATFRIG